MLCSCGGKCEEMPSWQASVAVFRCIMCGSVFEVQLQWLSQKAITHDVPEKDLP